MSRRAGTCQFVLTLLVLENIEFMLIINCLTKSMIMINSHSQKWHALDIIDDAPGPRVYLSIKTFIGFFCITCNILLKTLKVVYNCFLAKNAKKL